MSQAKVTHLLHQIAIPWINMAGSVTEVHVGASSELDTTVSWYELGPRGRMVSYTRMSPAQARNFAAKLYTSLMAAADVAEGYTPGAPVTVPDVLIDVDGGMVQAVYTTAPVNVTIIDHDCDEHPDDQRWPLPEVLEPGAWQAKYDEAVAESWGNSQEEEDADA